MFATSQQFDNFIQLAFFLTHVQLKINKFQNMLDLLEVVV